MDSSGLAVYSSLSLRSRLKFRIFWTLEVSIFFILETNITSSHLKIDGWDMMFFFFGGWPGFFDVSVGVNCTPLKFNMEPEVRSPCKR